MAAQGNNSSELAFFREKEQTLKLIHEILEEKAANASMYEEHVAKTLLILDKYQEQSQLLGPHVVDLVNPINEGLLRYLTLVDNVNLILCLSSGSNLALERSKIPCIVPHCANSLQS
jgi:hypothetical protein